MRRWRPVPKEIRFSTEIANIEDILRIYGYAHPELEHIDNPNTLEIILHPYTKKLLIKYPGLKKLLSDIHVKEKIRRLSSMDAAEKLIDLGLSSFGKEAKEKLAKKKRGRGDGK